MRTIEDVVKKTVLEGPASPCGDSSCLVCRIGAAYRKTLIDTAYTVANIEMQSAIPLIKKLYEINAPMNEIRPVVVSSFGDMFLTGILLGVLMADNVRTAQLTGECEK